jgi:hypothetical protein
MNIELLCTAQSLPEGMLCRTLCFLGGGGLGSASEDSSPDSFDDSDPSSSPKKGRFIVRYYQTLEFFNIYDTLHWMGVIMNFAFLLNKIISNCGLPVSSSDELSRKGTPPCFPFAPVPPVATDDIPSASMNVASNIDYV